VEVFANLSDERRFSLRTVDLKLDHHLSQRSNHFCWCVDIAIWCCLSSKLCVDIWKTFFKDLQCEISDIYETKKEPKKKKIKNKRNPFRNKKETNRFQDKRLLPFQYPKNLVVRTASEARIKQRKKKIEPGVCDEASSQDEQAEGRTITWPICSKLGLTSGFSAMISSREQLWSFSHKKKNRHSIPLFEGVSLSRSLTNRDLIQRIARLDGVVAVRDNAPDEETRQQKNSNSLHPERRRGKQQKQTRTKKRQSLLDSRIGHKMQMSEDSP
jgi:hypothetical protein